MRVEEIIQPRIVLSMTVVQAVNLADAIERDAKAQQDWTVGNYAQTIRAALRDGGFSA